MLNFRYAAYSYLNEYLRADKLCIDALESNAPPERICIELSKIAVIYNINRNLAVRSEDWRFKCVYESLMKVEKPVTDQDASDRVEKYSIELGKAYPRKSGMEPTLLSAASKFLWMRFKDPIVMYDRYAWQWIQRARDLGHTSSYSDYLRAWRESYNESEQQIAENCSDLVGFARFTLAADMSENELRNLVGQRWFRERVFDHAIIDAEQAREEEKQARKEARDSAG